MKIEVVVTDLWGEPEGGWSANGCFVNRYEIELPDDTPDAMVVRKIKSEAGITGWRKDDWCVADFGPWRDGSIGAYADVVV